MKYALKCIILQKAINENFQTKIFHVCCYYVVIAEDAVFLTNTYWTSFPS